ncbi:MAG: hypothetical protein NWP69_11210 [Congregibacter sp.]|nr:hypothetical protein [Congregibacter sp.]
MSEQLIEAARQERRADRPSTRSPQLASRAGRHRRRWQQLATVLLLVGSAAFSYLAWSQSDVRGLKDRDAQKISLPEPSAQTGVQTRVQTSVQANVHALRIQNRELQLRIAALQEALQASAPGALSMD